MASPALQSFCCMSANTSTYHLQRSISSQDPGFSTYNVLCLISSGLSIIGTIYQLWPKSVPSVAEGRTVSTTYLRQNCIIRCLALADLLASTGVFVRSSLWLAGDIPVQTDEAIGKPDFAHLFCAISSGWIQYFYICTYFWTFCYALDTYLVSHNKTSHMSVYHLLSWIFSAVITGAGLMTLYDPSLLSCEHGLGHLIPHYLSSYLPILTVMIVNPVLYAKVSQSVRLDLMRRGRFTNHERNIISSINEKFFLVIVIFYVCWLPNIVNGILLIFHKRIARGIFIGLWQYMALFNPVQALLNVLVYRDTGGMRCLSLGIRQRRGPRHIQGSKVAESTEHSPLLTH